MQHPTPQIDCFRLMLQKRFVSEQHRGKNSRLGFRQHHSQTLCHPILPLFQPVADSGLCRLYCPNLLCPHSIKNAFCRIPGCRIKLSRIHGMLRLLQNSFCIYHASRRKYLFLLRDQI